MMKSIWFKLGLGTIVFILLLGLSSVVGFYLGNRIGLGFWGHSDKITAAAAIAQELLAKKSW